MPAAKRGATLLRSTPFRLALTFAVLLVAAFILTGAAIYQQMRNGLIDSLDESLRSTYAVLADSYQDDDLEDIVAAVDSHAKLAAGDQLFSLLDDDGRLLAGTTLPNTTDGAHDILVVLPDGERSNYRSLTGQVHGNRLIVAFSTSEIEDLLSVVLASFGWASLAVAALAIGGGVWLARRAQRRLDAIADTMTAVSHGQLHARIPLIGSGDDIDHLSANVNAALDRLNNLVDGVRQVSNDIAHELRTPLNRLQLMVESTIERPSASRATLEEALREIGQLNATFEAMLRIASIESGVARARFAPVDLTSLLSDLVDIYADVATDRGDVLTYSGPTSGGVAPGDRDLLTQLFANLIENSLRHTPAGTHVSASIQLDQTSIVAIVADTGPGIPPEERDKVLRRLYRLDKSRSTPGSGLGLSIVAAIAGLHGADLSLEDNAPGLRTVVRFATDVSSNLSKS